MNPIGLTFRRLLAAGRPTAMVTHFDRRLKKAHRMFQFGDMITFSPSGQVVAIRVSWIQFAEDALHQSLRSPQLATWLRSGNRFQIAIWHDARKCTVREITLADLKPFEPIGPIVADDQPDLVRARDAEKNKTPATSPAENTLSTPAIAPEGTSL